MVKHFSLLLLTKNIFCQVLNKILIFLQIGNVFDNPLKNFRYQKVPYLFFSFATINLSLQHYHMHFQSLQTLTDRKTS